MSIENPTLAHFRHFSSLFTNLPSTTVENALQIDLFMQNKPNFLDAQMNVTSYITKEYENKSDWTLGENKPNSNPIKANTKPIKANKMPKQTQYKPNQTQFFSYPNPLNYLTHQPAAIVRQKFFPYEYESFLLKSKLKYCKNIR